ncbi:cytochrome P450 [soil metagenome]
MTTATLVFDPFSDDFFNGPYETYRRMRDEAPVYYNEQYDFYALTRHADVSAAYKDFETYSSNRGVDLAMVRKGEVTEHGSIIAMDPPSHRHMRSLLNKVFTPRAIQAQRPMVGALIDRYLLRLDRNAWFDMVQDFSALFPVEVITTMQGVPAEDSQRVRLWIDELLHRESGQVEMSDSGQKAAIDMAIYYYKLTKQRRDQLGDDLLSKLITSEIERENGEMGALTNIEITEFATLLGGAGAETVTKLIGNAAVVFAQFPDQWQRLQDDRSKIPFAVEELLRYEAPAQYNVRCSLREITLHGVTIPANKPVFLVGGSANRDPQAWTDPDRFDVDRDRAQAQNLGLGYGIHSCLGAALARMESAIALEKMLDFMPRFEVDFARCRRVNMQNVAGWSNVPVRVL